MKGQINNQRFRVSQSEIKICHCIVGAKKMRREMDPNGNCSEITLINTMSSPDLRGKKTIKTFKLVRKKKTERKKKIHSVASLTFLLSCKHQNQVNKCITFFKAPIPKNFISCFKISPPTTLQWIFPEHRHAILLQKKKIKNKKKIININQHQ